MLYVSIDTAFEKLKPKVQVNQCNVFGFSVLFLYKRI